MRMVTFLQERPSSLPGKGRVGTTVMPQTGIRMGQPGTHTLMSLSIKGKLFQPNSLEKRRHQDGQGHEQVRQRKTHERPDRASGLCTVRSEMRAAIFMPRPQHLFVTLLEPLDTVPHSA